MKNEEKISFHFEKWYNLKNDQFEKWDEKKPFWKMKRQNVIFKNDKISLSNRFLLWFIKNFAGIFFYKQIKIFVDNIFFVYVFVLVFVFVHVYVFVYVIVNVHVFVYVFVFIYIIDLYFWNWFFYFHFSTCIFIFKFQAKNNMIFKNKNWILIFYFHF